MTATQLIALELHDTTLWEPTRVLPMIEVMERWGYNALVLHQNDLLDEVTQLGLTANYGVSDLRLKKVRNKAAWLSRLVARLDQFGAKLLLEIKEPSFHDYALEHYPDLLGENGQPDPDQPVWAGFCKAKVEDLLNRVPGIGGLIVNLSSPESRVSMPDHVATGALDLDKAAWFDRMITAFHDPLDARGKALYIRDFSYTVDVQSDVMAAIARRGGSVQPSVKITAHDYFPRSPENPALGQISAAGLIEVDTFGEHTGWGVIPNCRVMEFGDRLARFRGGEAPGLLVRTSWEAIPGANALDSLSAVNVFALPRLLRGEDPGTVMRHWLGQTYGVDGEIARAACELLVRSWNIPAASYWGDQVFPRHSCLPSSWQEGWLSMDTVGMGRRDRVLGIAPDDPRLTEAARAALFAEKDAAVVLAKTLAAEAQALTPRLSAGLARLFESFRRLPLFARQFELASKGTFHAARGEAAEADRYRTTLLALAKEMDEMAPATAHEAVLFDPAQVRLFAGSLTAG